MALSVPPNVAGYIEIPGNDFDTLTIDTVGANHDFNQGIQYPALTGKPTAIYLDLIINYIQNTNIAANNIDSGGTLLYCEDPPGNGHTYNGAIDLRNDTLNCLAASFQRGQFRYYGGVDIQDDLDLTNGGSLRFRIDDEFKALANNLIIGELQVIMRITNYLRAPGTP